MRGLRRRRPWLWRALVGSTLVALSFGALFGILFANVVASAQPHKLGSASLAMDRHITVYPPAGYDPASARHYPTLYSLDGQSFRHRELPVIWARILAFAGLTPPMFIVAIDNEGTRAIDFRAPVSKPMYSRPPIVGRDGRFTGFIKSELIPFVERHYRVSAYRIISGHSLGGMYAVDRLSRSPGLFQAHFAYSPSFLQDQDSINRLRLTARRPFAEPTILYMNLGEENALYRAAFQQAAAGLAHVGSAQGLDWQAERLRGMMHPVMMIPGQMRAMLFLGHRANSCALVAAGDPARRACYR